MGFCCPGSRPPARPPPARLLAAAVAVEGRGCDASVAPARAAAAGVSAALEGRECAGFGRLVEGGAGGAAADR